MSFKSRTAILLAFTAFWLAGCAHNGQPPATTVEARTAGGHRFSADSTMAVLLDTPQTREVLMRHVPAVVQSPQISLARGLSLKQLASFSQAGISSQTLLAIDAELAKLN